MRNSADGSPTKAFFVEMLTRDIDLNDAILDLLDNCLDGVIRLSNGKRNLEEKTFYKGYRAEISISSNGFTIKDNCGGIPRNVAEQYAFRMGRASSSDKNCPTIGIYGIGMKRAIFKIGKETVVHTCNNGVKYSVKIPLEWVNNENDWSFPIEDSSPENDLDIDGTEIKVLALNDAIAGLWKSKSNLESFIEKLRLAIQESYSRIIKKGFVISINGKVISENPIKFLSQKGEEKSLIRPYVFADQYGSVNVKVVIGFYAPMPSDEEIDEFNESKRSTYEAGITIVCNDRIVLYNDKSNMTGWGVNGVPNYHTQFTGIKGVVVFESNTPEDLPMTTTKRGIDHSSTIYIAVKDKICEGLKMFTNYTNQWKGKNEQERQFSTRADKIDYDDLFTETVQTEYGLKLRGGKRGKTFRPNLPKPINDSPSRVIRFSKELSDIKDVIGYLYGDRDASIKASIVGEKCFDVILDKAKQMG